jgi:3-oxoadipate enol-lactonase
MPRLPLNGVETAYAETGAGPPLVFLHGAVQTLSVWDAQVAHFAPRFRCVAYDMRGHGASGLGDEPLSVGLLADDLHALLDALGIGRATLCGVSLGGMVALHAAARRPERVRALALANTPVALSLSPLLLRTIDALNPYALLRPAFRALDTGRAGRLGLRIALAVMGRDWVSGAAEHHFLKGFSTMRPKALVETYRAICEAGLPDMTRIRAPVLVVTGQAESGMIFRHAAEIARQVGRAELATVPGGHVTNLDAPDTFNAALDGFFGRWLAGTSLSD